MKIFEAKQGNLRKASQKWARSGEHKAEFSAGDSRWWVGHSLFFRNLELSLIAEAFCLPEASPVKPWMNSALCRHASGSLLFCRVSD